MPLSQGFNPKHHIRPTLLDALRPTVRHSAFIYDRHLGATHAEGVSHCPAESITLGFHVTPSLTSVSRHFRLAHLRFHCSSILIVISAHSLYTRYHISSCWIISLHVGSLHFMLDHFISCWIISFHARSHSTQLS